MTGLPREISGRQLLADIRAGTDDFGLMRKYEVTKRQLKALLKQLADAGVLGSLQKLALDLNAKEFVRDIRSGLDFENLRDKYAVTAEELRGVCELFCTTGLLSSYAPERGTAGIAEPVPKQESVPLVAEQPSPYTEKGDVKVQVIHYFPNSVLAGLRIDAGEVKRLLEAGMHPDARDRHLRRTALIWAVGYGNIDAVRLLVDKGADIHAKGKDARTALYFAIVKNHEAIREILLSRGAT